MACFEGDDVQIIATCKPESSVFHFPSFQFSASTQELFSCSRSIKLLRELYSLQVTYNPLWRRLKHQNTSRRTVQKLQVRRKVVVYLKVVLLWENLPHSVLEIMQLTNFFISTKLRDLDEMCYINEESLYASYSFLRGFLYNPKSGIVHRQLGGRSSWLCWAKRKKYSTIYLSQVCLQLFMSLPILQLFGLQVEYSSLFCHKCVKFV